MANTFRVTDMVAKESLRIAHESLGFINTVDRQYDEDFKPSGRSGLHGSTMRVKDPNQYTVRTGNAMAVQEQAESIQTITVATLKGIDMGFTMQELIQSVDNDGAFDDLSSKYIQPAISSLCSVIESDFIAFCSKATYNLVGSAGTALTTLDVPGKARAKLNQNIAPKGKGNRFIQTDSLTMGGMVTGVSGLFHDGAQIKEQYREGMMGRTAMADWYENDRMWTMPNSADVIGAINAGTLTSGITSLTVDGLTAAPVEGMVFTVAGVNAVHPETKASFGSLQQFVAGAGCTTTNLVFTPAIIFATTNPKQNVSGAPVTTAAITFVGSASTNYMQSLMYHKEAYQFIAAPLPIVDEAQKCVRVMKDGLSLRAWMGPDIRNNELLMRIDILYGFAALRPQWATRMIGAVS